MSRSVVRSPGRIAVVSLLLVLVGAAAATGSVAAEGGFEVEITDAADGVEENGDLEIEAEITNTGTDASTQELRLEDGDGDVLQAKSQVLGGGQSVTETFVWSDVPSRPTRSLTPTVRSEDDSDSVTTTIEWAAFEVRDLDLSREAVAGGDAVTFTGDIRNIGTIQDTQELVFTDVSGNLDTESLTLDARDSEAVTFDATAPSDPGAYTYSLSTANESAERSLRVLESAAFEVTITETTTDETGFELVAAIENDGEIEGIEDVTFSVDGSEVTTRSVTAQPNETRTERFEYDTGSESFAVDAAVETGQTTDTARVSRAAIDEGPRVGSVTPEVVRNDGAVTVSYTAAGPAVEAVSLTVTDPNGEPLLSREVDPGVERTTTVRLPGRDELVEGQYGVELTAEDESGQRESDSRENAFTAEALGAAGDAGFSRERYETPAGDFVEIDVSTGNLDEMYVLVAGPADGDSAGRYLDVLHVSGDATVVVNTRLVGTDRPSGEVYIPVDGEVTSYAHSIGAASEPQGKFDGLSFRNEDGTARADTLAAFRDEQGHTPLKRPLQPGNYRLVAAGSGTVLGGDGSADVRHPVARSEFVLTPPELGGVRTYTLPPAAADRLDQSDDDAIGVGDIGPLLGAATETDTVAEGDRLLIEIQSTGIYGALMADTAATNPAVVPDSNESGAIPASDVGALLDRREGVRLELAGNESAASNGGSELQFAGVDSGDLYVLPDDSADQWAGSDAIGTEPRIGGLYIVVDTRDGGAFNGRPTAGDELTVEIAYESPAGERFAYPDYALVDGEQPAPFSPVSGDSGGDSFPYRGASDTTQSVSTSFVVTEPSVDYDETTLDDELLVPAEAGGVITGETTIAPGSQTELRLTAADGSTAVTMEDVEIGPDRSFEATGDFSAFDPDADVEAAFYATERAGERRLIDSHDGRVVEDLDDPATFEIDGVSESVRVERGARLGDIAATITNTGEFADRQRVAFSVDGEPVREETVVLDSGEETTLDLGGEFVVLPAGEYSYAVSTDDSRQTGGLTVTGSGDGQVTADDGGATQSTPLEENDRDDGGAGLFGMIGLRGRDVAAAALVTAGTYVLGQWTDVNR